MGLESTTTIAGLVSTNPVGGVDPVHQGDDHIRLLKTVLKTTFPNVTGVLSASNNEFNYLVGVTSSIQTQIDAKLATASYTAADVLAKLLTVDGAASGLDADVLDGQQGSFYQNASNLNAGTLPDARFPATLPAVSGTSLTGVLKTASNLSDVANAATARANLGVTATGGDTTYSFRANNLSDLANIVTARANLGLVAIAASGSASDLSTGTVPDARFPATLPALSGVNLTGVLKTSNNLSDVVAATARSNLGVTATGADTTYCNRANNLSDLASAATARSNLGLVIGTNVPSPSGTGASGTWGIAISGNAATATLAAAATEAYVPRRTSGLADGQCLHTSSNLTVNTSDLAAGRTFSILNISGAPITITQGAGVTMYNTQDASTGSRTLGARGICTIRCESGSDCYISGNVS